MSDKNLKFFFKPRSVAIVGASNNKKKIGYEILKNIIEFGFKGKIYPVNLKGKNILGLKTYCSVSEISSNVDLAIISIPANSVNAVLERCGLKGIKNVVIISAGFKESGKEGKKLEEKLKETAKKFNIQIIGPNCLGVIDSYNKLNASFVSNDIPRGKIAFMSQSGAIISAILDWANLGSIGFSKMVSLGNKTVLSENNFIEYFKDDIHTSAVFSYLEDIKDGKNFIKSVSDLTLKKPFVIIKPGTSKSSKKAMQSHTGAIAGNEKGIELAMKNSGAIRVSNMQELFSLAKFFSRYTKLEGKRIVVLTNAGGLGVMATDELERRGLKLAKIEKKSKERMDSLLPLEASVNNPIDILGDAKSNRYEKILEIIVEDKNIDGILIILTPQAGTEVLKTAKAINKVCRNFSKPVVVNFSGGERINEGLSYLEKNNVVAYSDLSDAIFALSKSYEYNESVKRIKKNKSLIKAPLNISDANKIDDLDFISSLHLIKKFGVKTIPTLAAFSTEEVMISAERIGYPLVMKIFSDTISHKTDANGVKIGIKNKKEAREYFLNIKEKLGENLKGVLLQPMISGQEIIIGVKKDDKFGHMVMFGLGGVYAEIIKDTSFALVPFDKKKAFEMIKGIKSFRILDGYRSLPKINIDKLADALVNISNLVVSHPEIEELDINPIIANEKGYFAVDIRIINN